MNVYEAKFAREAKAHPVCWIIAPNGCGRFNLVRICADPIPKTKVVLVK